MQIYEMEHTKVSAAEDPTISITKWSYASGIDVLIQDGAFTALIKVSPELATKLGWALLEAAVAKLPEDAA